MKEFWQKQGWFTLAMVSMLVMFGGIYSLIHGIQFSVGTKLLLGFVLLFFLTLLIGGAAIASTQLKKKEKAPESERSTTEKRKESLLNELKAIIANVPENHIWVLRFIWRSNPNTFEGYYEKPEGLRIFIRSLWHDEVKLVSLVPLQRDPALIEVNSKDNLLPLVDYRIKTWVAQYAVGNEDEPDYKSTIENAATKYALRIEDRVSAEDQWAHVALNRVSSEYYCSKPIDTEGIGLTEMNRKQLTELLSEPATEAFNEEMKYFGIQGEIAIHNIRPPKSIEAASSQVTVAKLEKTAADYKAAAMKKIISETGASPTWTLIAESMASAARSILGAKEEKPVSSKNKEEEK